MKATVVVGGQYGSEAKGAVCGALHRRRPGTAGVRVGGSQAGHTVLDDEGRTWQLRHVPVAAAVDATAPLLIADGSEVDLGVLLREVQQLEAAGFAVRDRLLVSAQATLIEAKHQATEDDISTGSTKKGVGAARAARALRRARLVGDLGEVPEVQIGETQDWLLGQQHAIIEGVQGYGLGTHAGLYPYCTSSDCRAIDFMAMAGLTPQQAGAAEVWVVLRPYPIRIAGDSGPLAGETSWEQLGLPAERTTVTKKRRRVGQWDPELARRAVWANGGAAVRVALMQTDYVFPQLRDQQSAGAPLATLPEEVVAWVRQIEGDTGAKVHMLGTGPATQIRLSR